jgi:hypothetical protein
MIIKNGIRIRKLRPKINPEQHGTGKLFLLSLVSLKKLEKDSRAKNVIKYNQEMRKPRQKLIKNWNMKLTPKMIINNDIELVAPNFNQE